MFAVTLTPQSGEFLYPLNVLAILSNHYPSYPPQMASSQLSEQKPSGGQKSQRLSRHLNRLPSTQIPSRLRYGDDAHEDVTAPSRAGPVASQYMNQSIFSMIAAAGSRTDFNKRFDESSDSENDVTAEEKTDHTLVVGLRKDLETRSVLSVPGSGLDTELAGRKRRSSKHKLMQSLPRLTSKKTNTSDPQQRNDSPVDEKTSSQSPIEDPRDAPVMSRLLTAEAAFQAGDGEVAAESNATKSKTRQKQNRDRPESSSATLLATRLMEIFGFEKPEVVIAEYPCWLLQSVLLQGYLYITRKHICFYAYLPKKSNAVAKTGYLSKRGKNNPKYRRYWFSLKGDVFTYYSNPSDLYFPQGNIDLRYGISASLSAEKSAEKDGKDFSVTTNQRTYCFRADSATSAKEWVKSLQRTIFRSHNDGDSVKISLPVDNVIDIEESPVVEFAETVKVRIIESGDSYAIDEVRQN